ncbi:DUF3365 domain-containing protein [Thiomicrorhabdus sp.]|uniref:Tll0287-like domain-containing protein n=1 Tax=Thiomicrorhabdus sp. TaxID=2039724 RepID=UPI0029C9263B|nr:DUF3365 domain-containing protein [Thiomicrorhabdus sp.]
MKNYLLSGLIMALPLSAYANTVPEKQQEARMLAKEFLGQLKPELGKAMKTGGPIHAVDICHEKAPEIAKNLSEKSGWNVNRVSLKPRAATAKADAWETATMNEFNQLLAEGKDPKTLEKFEIVKIDGQDTYRYMKAIPTGKVCLTCHGETVPAVLEDKIKGFYPHDTAIGYKLGQLRGAFSFQQSVAK